MQRPRWAVGLAALFAAGVLTACSAGRGADDDVASAEDTDRPDATEPTVPGQAEQPANELTDDEREELLIDWAQCMRDHGVDQPDPMRADPNVSLPPGTPGGNIGIVTSVDLVEDPDFETAATVCEPLKRAGFASVEAPDDTTIAEERDRELAYARCLRGEGLDVPDPTYDDDGTGVAVGATLDFSDPDVQAAVETCSEEAQ